MRSPSPPPPPPPPPRAAPRPPKVPSPRAAGTASPLGRAFGAIGLFKCYFAAFAALAFAFLAPFTLAQVRDASAAHGISLDAVLGFFASHPVAISAICLPALAAAIVGVFDRPRRWLWLTISTVLLLVVLAVVLLALVALLKPFYGPRSL